MSSPARQLTTEVDASAEEVLRWAYETFTDVVIVASFQAESSVIIDMATRIRPGAHVLTLDTGRLPQATHDIIDRMRRRYDIRLDVISPDPEEIRGMVAQHGVNLFYGSIALRNACCEVRKTRPLERVLRGHSAWITGLRRDQSPTRAETPIATPDPLHHGIMKIAPLASWTRADVWDYIRAYDVPYHDLYDRGYTSIGCEPCTRAVKRGENERAGRWWWEDSDIKECSIHWPVQRPRSDA